MGDQFSPQFVVGIDANRTIKDELTAAISVVRKRRRISVTDLINPRQAFFRWTRPEIKPSPERQQLMMTGTGFHDLFGKAVSTEEFIEQLVECDGVVGKIDIFEDVPTELKTTGSIPDDIHANRPGYVDQLGLYCTMTGKPDGRLIIYKRQEWGRDPDLRVYNATFRSLGPIAAEMRRRRDMLQDALDRNDPSGLPCCEWRAVGCDYSHLCGCETAPELLRIVSPDNVRLTENAAMAAALIEQVRKRPPRPDGIRLNDLVFPRKAAYQRESEEEEQYELPDLQRQGFFGTLMSAIWYGVPGAFTYLPVELRSLRGRVGRFREVPTIIRASGLWDMVERHRLAQTMTHYFDRLAFECALTGSERGRLVVYYKNLEDDKFQVYDVTFGPLDGIAAELDRRLALLERRAHPHELPACPSWMARYCKFADECGCGAP